MHSNCLNKNDVHTDLIAKLIWSESFNR